jgi:hypothetical protein
VTNATVEDVSVAPFTYQVAFFASPTRLGVPVTSGLTLRNYRSGGTYADGVNIHGAHRNVRETLCGAVCCVVCHPSPSYAAGPHSLTR